MRLDGCMHGRMDLIENGTPHSITILHLLGAQLGHVHGQVTNVCVLLPTDLSLSLYPFLSLQ